jgi:hypothetical protein
MPTLSLRSVRRAATIVAAAGLVLLLAGCFRTVDPSLDAFELTPRLDEKYDITLSGSTMVVTGAHDNPHGTNRMGFWRKSDPTLANVESCATWTAEGDPFHQEGATLRLRTFGDGVRAITVTKNVYGSEFWKFNVHVWDTNNAEAPFTMIGNPFDLSATLGGGTSGQPLVPFPWRLCARAQGSQVDFVVWPASQPRPDYGTPDRGGSVTVPDGWLEPGFNGWYAGHLQPASTISFSDATLTPL